jgi:hypothetical protein
MSGENKEITCCRNEECKNKYECPNWYADKYRVIYLKKVLHFTINIIFLILFGLIFYLGYIHGK